MHPYSFWFYRQRLVDGRGGVGFNPAPELIHFEASDDSEARTKANEILDKHLYVFGGDRHPAKWHRLMRGVIVDEHPSIAAAA